MKTKEIMNKLSHEITKERKDASSGQVQNLVMCATQDQPMIAEDNFETVEAHETEYFGCKIEVWRIKGPYWRCAPWRFAVTHKGKRREFVGVPNHVETKAKALKRSWYRAKWLDSGEYHNHYT